MPESTLEAVFAYLVAKFPDSEIEEQEASDETEDVRVQIDDLSLRISSDFLESVEADEVTTILDWLDVPGELRRSQGLPMVLTEHGVRLESGN